MGYLVRYWIDSTVQPISMFLTLNHRLIKCDVIRFLVTCQLSNAFMNPIVDCLSATPDTQSL